MWVERVAVVLGRVFAGSKRDRCEADRRDQERLTFSFRRHVPTPQGARIADLGPKAKQKRSSSGSLQARLDRSIALGP